MLAPIHLGCETSKDLTETFFILFFLVNGNTAEMEPESQMCMKLIFTCKPQLSSHRPGVCGIKGHQMHRKPCVSRGTQAASGKGKGLLNTACTPRGHWLCVHFFLSSQNWLFYAHMLCVSTSSRQVICNVTRCHSSSARESQKLKLEVVKFRNKNDF